MIKYNIEIREFNGTDYDILYPLTTMNNVEGLNNSLSAMNTNINNVANKAQTNENKISQLQTTTTRLNNSIQQINGNIQILDQDISNLTNSISNIDDSKQDKLTFDTVPTADSLNPVTSGGIKNALDEKVSKTGNSIINGMFDFNREDGTTLIRFRMTDVSVSTPPETSQSFYPIVITDGNRVTIGTLRATIDSFGNSSVAIGSARNINGENVTNHVITEITASGERKVTVSSQEAWRKGLGAPNGIWPISLGGTGASTAQQARTNLGAPNGIWPISLGGTGASTAEQARTNLGIIISNSSISEGSALTSGLIYIYYE